MARTSLPASSTVDGRARGRSVGFALDKAGALLVADDSGNTVWRITSAQPQVTQR